MHQGALDGGLNVPHSEKRFVGYSRDDKSLDADTLRKFIYGGHIADYMNEMEVTAAGDLLSTLLVPSAVVLCAP